MGDLTGHVSLPDGGVGTPALYFTNDATTGVYRPAASTFAITGGGKDIIRMVGGATAANYFNLSASAFDLSALNQRGGA